MVSSPTSSERSWVSRPSSAPTIWSIDTPARKSTPSVGLAWTPVRNAPPMRPCPPAGSPGRATAGLLSSPDTTISSSRIAASGPRMGDGSNPAPSVAGVQLSITAPMGT